MRATNPGPLAPEDRFTGPTEWCPNPQHWHSTDGASTEVEVTELVASFVRALQPELVVETGTAHGQTAEAIGRALATNGHGRLVTIELNPTRVASSRDRCTGLPVEIVQSSSLDWRPDADEAIGFAWFDSEIHLRAAEFKAYRPWMTPGVIVGFHDTGPQHKLQPDIEQLGRDGALKAIRLHTPRGVSFAEVL